MSQLLDPRFERRSPSRAHGTRVRTARALVAISAGLTLVVATAGAALARSVDTAARFAGTVTITARDYAFEAPDTVAAGVTTIRLVNRGPELHHVQFIRLGGEHTLGDFFTALKAGGPPPVWATLVGGPNAPVPGATSEATVDLPAGRYAVVCFIPSKDGTPHVMKGMAKEIVAAPRATVTPARYSAPKTTMVLTDYHFGLARPLVAGRQTIRVRNDAQQAHEVLFVRLAPGKTAGDVAAWIEKEDGPAPGAPIGGTTGISHGGWNDVTVTLEPGEYALLCFFPDAGDGKPHVAHGMVTQFTVR